MLISVILNALPVENCRGVKTKLALENESIMEKWVKSSSESTKVAITPKTKGNPRLSKAENEMRVQGM